MSETTLEERMRLFELVSSDRPDDSEEVSLLAAVLRDLDQAQRDYELAEAAASFKVEVNHDPELVCIYCHRQGCERSLRFRNRAKTVWHGIHIGCAPEMAV